MNRDYSKARAEAQEKANSSGYDYGIERLGTEWHVFILPQKRHRFGFETRCEVVMCEHIDRCKPGHGPDNKS